MLRKSHPWTFSKPSWTESWATQPTCKISLAESLLKLKRHTGGLTYMFLLYILLLFHYYYFFLVNACKILGFQWHPTRKKDVETSYLIMGDHSETPSSLPEISSKAFIRKAGNALWAIIIKSKLPEFSLHFPGGFCSLQRALRCHGYSYKQFTPPLKLITSQLQHTHTLSGNSATDFYFFSPSTSSANLNFDLKQFHPFSFSR